MLFKKNEEEKVLFEELNKQDLAKLTLEYNRTAIGCTYSRMCIITMILVAFTILAEFTASVAAGGCVNVASLFSTALVGVGLYFIIRMLYYNSLERYYYKKIKFNKQK